MANKKQQSVWTPTVYETTIGGETYIIEPQPIERVLEFDTVVKQISEGLSGITTRYQVVDKESGDVLFGPTENEDEAKTQVTSDTELEVVNPSFREIASTVVSAPYPALKCLIPDLKEEHVRKAPFPNLRHVLKLIIEVNGVEWFETFLKNSLSPLLPEIISLVVDTAKQAIKDTTPAETKMVALPQNGEKP